MRTKIIEVLLSYYDRFSKIQFDIVNLEKEIKKMKKEIKELKSK